MEFRAFERTSSIALNVLEVLRQMRSHRVAGYVVAVAAVGLASWLQWTFADQYAGTPFLTIYPAVVLAALAGGLGAGLFSAVLAGLSQFTLFIPDFRWIAALSYACDATICVLLIVLINHTIDALRAKIDWEKEVNQQQVVIANELHHRIQNLFAVIQAVIRFSMPKQGSIDASEARRLILDRVHSMATANRIITESMGNGVLLSDLLDSEIQEFAARFDVDGGMNVVLSPRMAQSLALVIHELLTNALKHGALSIPDGRIRIQIGFASARLRFRWRERSNAPSPNNANTGYGSVLLGSFAKTFCETVDASYKTDGLDYLLEIPLDNTARSENNSEAPEFGFRLPARQAAEVSG